MTLANLKDTIVEEGREHPFVRALVIELRGLQQVAQMAVVGLGVNGGAEWQLRVNAARAVAISDVLRLIETTKGVEE